MLFGFAKPFFAFYQDSSGIVGERHISGIKRPDMGLIVFLIGRFQRLKIADLIAARIKINGIKHIGWNLRIDSGLK